MNEQPADEVVGTYGGDAFGNGELTMLRCRQCTGLYIKAPDPYEPTIMGLILIDDDGRGQRRQESKLAEIYSQGPKCGCPRTEELDHNWLGGRRRSFLRPPMYLDERDWMSDKPGLLFERRLPTVEPEIDEE